MTVQEAINNIATVVSNARMTEPEHDALKHSITLVAQRCKLADELAKEKEDATDLSEVQESS